MFNPTNLNTLTATDVAFIYPDYETVLLGDFVKGKLVNGREGKISKFRYKKTFVFF